MTLCTLMVLLAGTEREAGCGGPALARPRNMSFPERQAREAWGAEPAGEEQGEEEEKEPAIVKALESV
jgi:hypothetical protein